MPKPNQSSSYDSSYMEQSPSYTGEHSVWCSALTARCIFGALKGFRRFEIGLESIGLEWRLDPVFEGEKAHRSFVVIQRLMSDLLDPLDRCWSTDNSNSLQRPSG